MAEIARADDLVPRLEKAVNVAEEVMDEARGMGTAEGTVSKDHRIKAGHLALHATRRIQSGLGTLSAAVERRKARETEEKRQDLEGVRARVREELAALRERTIEELERQMTEEVERRVAEKLAQGGAPEKTDTPAAKPTGPGVH